jgi:hypothetical protein
MPEIETHTKRALLPLLDEGEEGVCSFPVRHGLFVTLGAPWWTGMLGFFLVLTNKRLLGFRAKRFSGKPSSHLFLDARLDDCSVKLENKRRKLILRNGQAEVNLYFQESADLCADKLVRAVNCH